MPKGPGNPIPEESRRIVARREADRCARCLGSGTDWHHRRSRAVGGPHQHCACNGVLLCRTCHAWAHRWAVQAKAQGFVVRRDELVPQSVPQRRLDGWWMLACSGAATPLRDEQVTMRAGAPALV